MRYFIGSHFFKSPVRDMLLGISHLTLTSRTGFPIIHAHNITDYQYHLRLSRHPKDDYQCHLRLSQHLSSQNARKSEPRTTLVKLTNSLLLAGRAAGPSFAWGRGSPARSRAYLRTAAAPRITPTVSWGAVTSAESVAVFAKRRHSPSSISKSMSENFSETS